MNDPYGALVATAICIPAIIFALQRSSWLIDYLFFVLAFNRGIRRFVDYQNGEFNPYSLISVSPLVVGSLAFLVILIEFSSGRHNISKTSISVLKCYSLAVMMAFIVGIFNARFAAIYALGDYIASIGLLGYGAIFAGQPKIIDRWCTSVVFLGSIVGAYGIWQFYTIPPWDAFWVRAVNFEGYLGELEPTKMTLFSTLNERGPAASYLCNSLIVLLLRPNAAVIFKPLLVPLIGYAMLLTYVRTTVIQLGIALIVFPLINRGVGKWPVFFISLIFFFFGEIAAQSIPGASKVSERLSTLSDIQNDASFKGRVALIRYALKASFSEPLGLGIGSHGLGGRVSRIEVAGVDDSSGYVQIFRTFGWIGFLLIVYVFVMFWRCSSDLISKSAFDVNVMLFRAWFVSSLVACFSGDVIMQPIFLWVLAGYCLEQAWADKDEHYFILDDDESTEIVYG